MSTPQFRTSTGRLTAYSFACGYIERKSTKPHDDDGIETEIWMEHMTYHVRQHDFGGAGRVFWESFDLLSEARNCFGRAKGVLVTARVSQEDICDDSRLVKAS